jgi:MoxR-like ATPase
MKKNLLPLSLSALLLTLTIAGVRSARLVDDRRPAAAQCGLKEDRFAPESFPKEWETAYKKDPEFLKKCISVKKVNGEYVLTKENRWYFNKNVDNLRSVWMMLKRDYFEMDHSIKRVFMSLMMGTHAYFFGEPGAAKSAIAQVALHLPHYNLFKNAKGKTEVKKFDSFFGLQLHQMINESVVKGWADLGFTKDSDEYKEYRDMIKTKGTLIEFERGLADELDKTNPVAAAAMLDVLAEGLARHGSVTFKAKTKTVIATSNMTVYEFIESMEANGMGSTARALLDRLPLKVFHANNLFSEKKERQLVARKAQLWEEAREARLADREITEEKLQLLNTEKLLAGLPDVDFGFLQDLMPMAESITKNVSHDDAEAINLVVRGLTRQIGKRYKERIKRTSTDFWAAAPGAREPIYFPSWIFSIRNIPLISKGIASSLFLDLAVLPEEKMPRPALEQMIRKGMPIDLMSTWRVQDLITTAAPGDPRLTFTEDASGVSKVSLGYGPELTFHEDNAAGRVLTMLKYIREEREDFTEVWTTLMNDHLKRGREVSEHIAELYELLGLEEKPESIEILLAKLQNELDPREVYAPESGAAADPAAAATGPAKKAKGKKKSP